MKSWKRLSVPGAILFLSACGDEARISVTAALPSPLTVEMLALEVRDVNRLIRWTASDFRPRSDNPTPSTPEVEISTSAQISKLPTVSKAVERWSAPEPFRCLEGVTGAGALRFSLQRRTCMRTASAVTAHRGSRWLKPFEPLPRTRSGWFGAVTRSTIPRFTENL